MRGAGIGLAGIGSYSSAKSLSQVLEEVESDVEGLAFIEDYSVSTATAIEKLMLPAKTYFQLFVAYGASAAMMVAGGIVIVVLVQGEKALMALGLLLLVGGLLVGVLALKAFRNWGAPGFLFRFHGDHHREAVVARENDMRVCALCVRPRHFLNRFPHTVILLVCV